MTEQARPSGRSHKSDYQLDGEFLENCVFGKIPSLDHSKIADPVDPTGRNFSWLVPPSNPYDAAYDKYVSLPPEQWYESGGPELRAALIYKTRFIPIALESYLAGAKLLIPQLHISADIDSLTFCEILSGGPTQGLSFAIASLLESVAPFSDFTPEQRVLVSLLVIESQKSELESRKPEAALDPC